MLYEISTLYVVKFRGKKLAIWCFQQKSLFKLVNDLFKWLEGLRRSVNVRLQSEAETIFDLGGIRKKYLIRCQISRSKTRCLVFQHKSLFNLVKNLFKWLEGLRRSVTVRVQSEGERIFDPAGIRKKCSIRCQILRSKTRYIVFQHKLVFNLVKGLFKWSEGLGRSVTTRVQSEEERFFDLGAIRNKYSIRCQISRSKTRYMVFSTKIAFQISQWHIQMTWGSKEECQCPTTIRGGDNFWPRWYTKKVLDTLSNFALKNSLYSVSTQIAFQPSQELIQMTWGSKEECHCPITVWGGKNFWPRCYTKKVLYTLSNFALKNSLYSVST